MYNTYVIKVCAKWKGTYINIVRKYFETSATELKPVSADDVLISHLSLNSVHINRSLYYFLYKPVVYIVFAEIHFFSLNPHPG